MHFVVLVSGVVKTFAGERAEPNRLQCSSCPMRCLGQATAARGVSEAPGRIWQIRHCYTKCWYWRTRYSAAPLNILWGNCAQYQYMFHDAVLSGNIFNAQHHKWQKTLDVDLTAVMVGTRLAVQCMRAKRNPGKHCGFQTFSSCHCVIKLEIDCPSYSKLDPWQHIVMPEQPCQLAGLIITVASAAGIFPVAMAPVYATAKSGVIHFTRSVAPRLRKRNIRICALCPQQVDTPMVSCTFYLMFCLLINQFALVKLGNTMLALIC